MRTAELEHLRRTDSLKELRAVLATDLSLCDDLGDGEPPGTGSDVVAWLAQRGELAGPDLWPRATLALHATSPCRSRRMEEVVDRFAPLARVPGRPPRWRRRTR